jgi:hypothetical protein
MTDAPGAAPRQEREALEELAYGWTGGHTESMRRALAREIAGLIRDHFAGYVTPEAHAAVVAERNRAMLACEQIAGHLAASLAASQPQGGE